jgi:uncharacterized protein (DUF1684 family)
MFPRHAHAFVFAGLATLLASGCGRSEPAPPATAPMTEESPVVVTEKWRAKHDADYRRDWVSIAGLFALKAGRNTAGSAATNDIVLPASVPARVGTLSLADGRVRFEPAAGVPVQVKGQPVTARMDLRDDSGQADELTVGDVRLVVHKSGEHLSLRVRDPNGPLAKGFKGFTWFPIDLAYRVTGKFIHDAEPKPMKVLNTFNDVDEYKTEGVVEFSLQGQTVRLRPFTTRPNRFYFVFRDASSGQETYETARFLYSDLLPDGTTVLDFNQAYNPPCAFNPYTTCPIPLKENHLPVKVLAGERAYPDHVPLGPPKH